MNVFRSITLVLITILLIPFDASAHCKGKHSGDHPHCVSEPPPACDDTFPSFIYHVEGSRRSPGEVRLASSDVCRSELLGTGNIMGPMHMTADGSKGVIVWRENTDVDNQHIVRRLDFTVDASGNVDPGQPVTILPPVGEEQGGDFLSYDVTDVWGDATHNSLYVLASRHITFNSGPNAGRSLSETFIYNLNTLTGGTDTPLSRKIYEHWNGDSTVWWVDAGDPSALPDCYSVFYPQFVPTCYKAASLRFNPSGTRLYLDQGLAEDLQDMEVELWHSTMRLDIDKETVGSDLAQWIIGGPELVTVVDFRGSGGPETLGSRPAADPYTLPDPEIVGRLDILLNADTCAAQYSMHPNGDYAFADDFWLACIDTSLVGHTGFGNGQVWESADTYLFDRNGKTNSGGEIYRMTVTGPNAGIEQLLIKGSRAMDTGL